MSTILTRPHLVAIPLLILGSTACYRFRHSTGMNGSAATPAQTQSSTNALTTARCDHEMRCGEVGRGEKYDSYQSCQEHIRTDWGDELKAFECSHGVNTSKLVTCANSMRTESCGTVLKALGEYGTCDSSAICLN